ncbi:unnamed protein product [Orchesella dallaii]|uniref:SEC7 domain-containing protein n=1 Tax=Orchesella dallaii TaxID=48710 RepID=A0ABP1Q2I9_9HEXA
MKMLISRLLTKLIQDVQQTKKAYFSQVERACNSALQDIRTGDVDGENDHKVLRQRSLEYEQPEDAHDTSANLDLLVGEEVRPQVSVDSEKFFLPFELACNGDVAKITITALDGIQKLIAYGELIGDYPDPKTPARRLIDRIVNTICSCYSGLDTDEGVELQIIKALLTIVTSEHVQVHESTLLLILRTCYIIHLTTKSAVNQRTARAMLTQMLHSIFFRMEMAVEYLDQHSKSDKTSAPTTFGSNVDWEAEFVVLVQECFSDSVLSVPSSYIRQSTVVPPKYHENTSFLNHTTDRDINQNSESLPEKCEQIGDRDSVNEPNEQVTQTPSIDDHNETSETVNDNCSSGLLNDPEDALNPFLQGPTKNPSFSSEVTSLNVLQKDAFLNFWALTKLALKPLSKSDSERENDKTAAENKFQQAILAFHLLKEILEKSGIAFKESPIFINAMKQHLYQSLIENGISQNAEVFKLEVEIIMLLIVKFKEVMIDEIQGLLDAMIFPILEGTISVPPHYNKTVLKSLKDISHHLDCFVYLYLSSDQDHDISHESKSFQKVVSCVSKIVRDRLGNEEIAVEIIANLLKSMSQACPKLDESSNKDIEKVERITSLEEPPDFEDDALQTLELEGKDFLTCLHMFLAQMDTPCDALKIDWLVQKLAQKMTDTSSVNSFKTETADCWYALIYASMNLIADIKVTNCQGKSKMSKNQFIKLNRGINGCEPLDEACLSSIYDEIDANYRRDAGVTKQIKWLDGVEKGEEEILRTIKSILESTSLLRSHFSLAKQLKHVKRMIKICGTSFLIALVNALQSTNDTKLSDVCLDGLHSGIRVACILGLDNEREAFVQALAKLSVVALDEIRGKHINSKVVTTTTSSLTMTENGVTKTVVTTTTEMKCRSVDVILTLLDVGIAEGNHLGGSWLHILKFISQLLSTPLLAESRNSSRSSSPVPPPAAAAGSGWAAWAGSLRESLEKKLWDPSATVLHPSVKESIASSVEKVFKRSEMLTGDAMTEFFQALCQVALHDMMNSETPRHLMYEKINEVVEGNIYRPALQWSQIWQVVADYFCHLACSSKEEISTIAIDSIQKLVLKLLKKETLNGYRFQNHYFSPLKVIITNTRSQSTREAVLGFVETVISLHGDLLLSGWIAILSILVTNMLNHSDKDAADSFRVLEHVVDKCQKGEVNLRNSFGSIVKALIDIASNIAPTLEMSEQAFRLLTQMAEVPYRQPQLLMEENDDRRYRVWSRGWKPILSELSAIFCNDSSSVNSNASCKLNNESKLPSWDIKTKTLITLFEVIKTYGSSFEKEWWNSVFEVLFNIFNCIKSHEKQDMLATQTQLQSASSPSTSDGSYKYFYCYYYVQFAIFDVYTQYYDATSSYVFDELLKHLQWCICQDHEQIALSGVSCLQQLVVALGQRFSENQWDSVLNVFQTICQPSGFTQNNNLEGQATKDEVIQGQTPAIRAVIQLELLKITERVIFSGSNRKSVLNSLSDNVDENASLAAAKNSSFGKEINPFLTRYQISLIVEILNRSHEIAKERCVFDTNASYELESTSKIASPNFIPHETLSLQIYWKVLFSVFKTGSESSQSKLGISYEALWEIIQQSCVRSCGYFITIQIRDHSDAWADLLCFMMGKILELPKPYFEEITSHLYPYFCDMLEIDLDSRICDKLREYLIQLGRDYSIVTYQIPERNKDGAFENDSQLSVVPKNCNTSAQSQLFQPTLNEGYVNHSKDCQ